MKFNFLLLNFSIYSLLKNTYVISCLSYYSKKKCYKHRQRKKETIHILKRKKNEEYNQHRDIQRQKKNQIMDYINTDNEFGK